MFKVDSFNCAGVTISGPAADPGAATAPFDMDRLLPGEGEWEVEIGFGKGKFLLREAAARPEVRFFGIEVASKYFRLAAQRAARRRLENVALVRGEALYVLTALLPAGFASAVHVYFPDPWPKARHQKRRLFDHDSVDLVLRLLRPGGELYFATDFLEYGAEVEALLRSYPGVDVTEHREPWPDGARTNYEAKYMVEGRPILRLVARPAPEAAAGGEDPSLALHPEGRRLILSALAAPEDD